MQAIIERKELSSILHSGPSDYENFKRVMEVSPSTYSHDLSVYTDDVNDRHDRNMGEWRKIKQLIREGKLTPQMLPSNTWNTFFPSYVMDHHFSCYMRLISQFSKSKNPVVHTLIQKGRTMESVGAVFYVGWQMNYKTYHLVSQPPTVSQNQVISMNPQLYYYAKNTSALITHCAILVQTKGGNAVAIVKLRNDDGSLVEGVSIKDFGSTISSDYHVVAYNFNNVKAEAVQLFNNEIEKITILLRNVHLLQEFKYSLNDLKKSLHLTIKYTGMRRQFSTLQGTKEERRIITYQAVASRILDGYSTLCAFSFLTLRLQSIPQLAVLFTPILQYSHHTILERVIHLRQCCGGFGYLQYSGHPGSIERIAYRAANKLEAEIPESKQFLKRAQFYSGDDSLEAFFGEKIDGQNIFNFSELWRVFILICIQMRKRKSEITKTEYTRQFVKQSAIQAMYNFDSMGRSKVDDISLMLQYQVVWYIIDNGKYISWNYVKIEPSKFYEGIQDFKRNLTIELSKKLEFLDQVLEIDYVRNALLGREDSEQFYSDVMCAAKTNKRNSPEFLAYVKQPIIQMLNENRGSHGKL